jgi:hypothetical protein
MTFFIIASVIAAFSFVLALLEYRREKTELKRLHFTSSLNSGLSLIGIAAVMWVDSDRHFFVWSLLILCVAVATILMVRDAARMFRLGRASKRAV